VFVDRPSVSPLPFDPPSVSLPCEGAQTFCTAEIVVILWGKSQCGMERKKTVSLSFPTPFPYQFANSCIYFSSQSGMPRKPGGLFLRFDPHAFRHTQKTVNVRCRPSQRKDRKNSCLSLSLQQLLTIFSGFWFDSLLYEYSPCLSLSLPSFPAWAKKGTKRKSQFKNPYKSQSPSLQQQKTCLWTLEKRRKFQQSAKGQCGTEASSPFPGIWILRCSFQVVSSCRLDA